MKKHARRIVSIFLVFCLILGITATAAAANQPVRGKLVAMTFDDGPSKAVTAALLDELASRSVKCTFFVLGQYAKLYPELVERAYSEGHQIASHTYNHLTLTTQTDYTVSREIERTRALLEEITGESSFMLRLPYGDGAASSRILGYADAPVILWSVDATNGKYPSTEEQLYNGILKQAHDGAIILMHDTNRANMRAALRAIDKLQEGGYSFVTVEELFRLKGVEPQNNKVYYKVSDAGTYYDESRLAEHWAYSDLTKLLGLGILRGDGTGLAPNGHITRAMAVTLLWRAAGEPETLSGSGFADVPEGKWYSVAVAWGRETGIVQGYSAELFAPADIITREQFCTLIIRLAEYENAVLPSGLLAREYSDGFRVSAWAAASLERLRDAGFISKNEASVFRPGDSMTRAEAAELIAWYLDFSPEEEEPVFTLFLENWLEGISIFPSLLYNWLKWRTGWGYEIQNW